MISKLILIPLFTLALCACGFHLRHSQSHLGSKYPVIVLTPTGSHTLHQALHRALLASSVEVLDRSEEKVPRLEVLAQQLTQQPLVYGPDAELRRERLKMSVRFSFHNALTKQFELRAERDRQINPNQHLGDNAEKIIIEQEMLADIISQLLRYLASSA